MVFSLPSSSIMPPPQPTPDTLGLTPGARMLANHHQGDIKIFEWIGNPNYQTFKNATGILGGRGVDPTDTPRFSLGPTTFHWDLHDPEADFVSNKQICFCLNSCTQRWSICWVFLLESGIYYIHHILYLLILEFLLDSWKDFCSLLLRRKKTWACFCKKKTCLLADKRNNKNRWHLSFDKQRNIPEHSPIFS